MKILELTNYSAGTCGVFSRVLQESKLLSSMGHDLHIFSSNRVKGSKEVVQKLELSESIKITRFPAQKLGGESFMSWNFKSAALKLKPDLIIAHSYRHPHTLQGLKIAKLLKIPIFLVTHAPFDSQNSQRSFLSKTYIEYFYDPFIGTPSLKKFSKILTIANWETPNLIKMKVPKNKIEYIPNGLSETFFKQSIQSKEKNKIIFLGRISPIKNIQTAIRAMQYLDDKTITLEIIGPAEKTYLEKLKYLTKELNLTSRVSFKPAISKIKEKIKLLDSAKLFVLPSLREGHPQALIEAMARKKLVIASKNPATQELIQDKKSGFLFQTKNPESLANSINYALKLKSLQKNKIQNSAQKTVKQFSWNLILEKLEKLIKKHSSQKQNL